MAKSIIGYSEGWPFNQPPSFQQISVLVEAGSISPDIESPPPQNPADVADISHIIYKDVVLPDLREIKKLDDQLEINGERQHSGGFSWMTRTSGPSLFIEMRLCGGAAQAPGSISDREWYGARAEITGNKLRVVRTHFSSVQPSGEEVHSTEVTADIVDRDAFSKAMGQIAVLVFSGDKVPEDRRKHREPSIDNG